MQNTKEPTHAKESGSTQRVPMFSSHGTKTSSSATDVGRVIVEMFDFVRCNVIKKEKLSGQWVFDETIMCVMHQLETLASASMSLFRPFETLSQLSSFQGMRDATIDPRKDVVLIVNDDVNKHFFTVLIETYPRQKTIHVFDTLVNRKEHEVYELLEKTFTPSTSFRDYKFHNYAKNNFTRALLQSGASCGPWSLWISVAFVFDINNCRRQRSNMHGHMRVASLKMDNDDIIGFWKELTCYRPPRRANESLNSLAIRNKKKNNKIMNSQTSR